MSTKEDRLQYFDRNKFLIDNEGFVEIMEINLKESISTAIVEGNERFDQLERCYKLFYDQKTNMTPALQKEFARHAHTLKGQANICYIDKMFQPTKHLQTAIDKAVRDDIDKYMYQSFAFKRSYLECLHAMQDELVDLPEFDLRIFDAFSGLSLASTYQSIPINAKSITFNQKGCNQLENIQTEINSQELLKNQEEKYNLIQDSPNNKEFEDETHCFAILRDVIKHEDPQALYALSKQIRDKGTSLYLTKKQQHYPEDFPFDSQLSCSIF